MSHRFHAGTLVFFDVAFCVELCVCHPPQVEKLARLGSVGTHAGRRLGIEMDFPDATECACDCTVIRGKWSQHDPPVGS
ncbi:hypothetical protein CSUI_009338 [Cystoisospora suis]|uniref:Secreted protein n=1 Tax=Cystoisospora suis TaxID=483139 RepID=A0A2C6KK49_9APIC|nr:hypothetical protein CSUI_009338 [Cystoisospora suis]